MSAALALENNVRPPAIAKVLERCAALDPLDPALIDLQRRPSEPGAYRELARKLVVLGQPVQAQQMFELGLSLDCNELFSDWVLALSRTTPLEQLRAHLQDPRRDHQCDAGRAILDGLACEWRGELAQAIDHYRSALVSRSDLMLAHQLCQALHRAYRNAEMPAVYEQHVFPALSIPRWDAETPVDKVHATHAIAVYFYGRGGSAFFNSLLDGHPDIIGPTEGFEHIGYFWKNGAQASPQAMLSMVAMPFHGVANLDGMFLDRQAAPVIAPSTCRLESKVNRLRYLSAMQYIVEQRGWGHSEVMTGAQYMTTLCLAYMMAQDRPFKNGDVAALFHAHHRLPTREQFIHAAFDRVRTVFCIRNPFQTLASHHQSSAENPIHDPAHVGSKYSFGVDLLNEYIDPERAESCIGIRLEDLKYRAEPTLRTAIKHLEIGWHDSLLVSTMLGKPYTFVSGNGERIKGFDPAPLKRQYASYFSRHDELRIRLLMASLAERWGYDPPQWYATLLGKLVFVALLWVPFRLERRQIQRSRQLKRSWPRVLIDGAFEYVQLRRLFLRKFSADLSGARCVVTRLVPDS